MRIPRSSRRDTVYHVPHGATIRAQRIVKTAYAHGCDRCNAAVDGKRSVLMEYFNDCRQLNAVFDPTEDELRDVLCYACFRALTPGDIAARLLAQALNERQP